jgi:hypothetical protein
MAPEAGKDEEQPTRLPDQVGPLTDTTDEPKPSASEHEGKGKAAVKDSEPERPVTATPSFVTQHSVDSGFGEEDSPSKQDIHGQPPNQNAQEALNLTDDQAEGLQHALNGEQLAEEQDLIPDVRIASTQRFRCRRSIGIVSHHHAFNRTSIATPPSGATRAWSHERWRKRKHWLTPTCRESTTTSLAESIWNYRTEHGRTYHGE